LDGIISFIVDLPLTSIAVALVAAVAFILARRSLIDTKYGVARFGGRGGHLAVRTEEGPVRVGFEVGGTVDLIVYSTDVKRGDGSPVTASQRNTALQAVQAWGKARGISLDTGA
jgi:hypothetical protein